MIKRRILIEETNILLTSDIEPSYVVGFITHQREELKRFIRMNKEFQTSLEPLKVVSSPEIVKMMSIAAQVADVGPMAAVAGTISQLTLNFLLKQGAKYVIVENGGDIALKTNKDVIMGLYAGESSLSGKIGFKIKHGKTPMGICTSSGTVGHSISFGKADSVTVFSESSSVADALATSIANHATGDSEVDMVENCLAKAEEVKEHFRGVLIVVGESAGTVGKIPDLVETDKKVVLGDLYDLY
ncbi:UPF0280 protein [Methanobacterium sp. MB1]|jgi:ApbE superfamily uncharacterized protein (UPF0280 family)|uniref:UPF0280 family protein n=1 Tax=Methanobacterium sp. TaxID=2164 RepID=UPI0003C96595|nr:UPF0280 family protein [uncultured Methanobacterium sp.]CDG64443.1 UPF0280 protein [Methanobacterium sp. MB1]